MDRGILCRPDKMSLISGIHVKVEEKTPFEKLSSGLQTSVMAHMPICNIHSTIKKLI